MPESSELLATMAPPDADREFPVERIREDFPILNQQVYGKPLVYLDNAASAQKPRVVIDTMARFDAESYANIHRGVHALSQRATDAYEAGRAAVRRFLNAAEEREIVFVRGATEAINLVAATFGRMALETGDEVLVTEMEHHANIVPWQMVCRERGATLRAAPINEKGEVRLDEFESRLGPRTKLVSIAHVSNALGTINPVREMIDMAHRRGIPVLVDGAQAVPHLAVDVQELDCDFYAFSGHKVFGPTGIGVLYGKAKLLESLPPYQGGGEMIRLVTFEKTIYNGIPHKFEAGTPNITGTVGLGAALEYLRSIGRGAVARYEQELLAYATEPVGAIPGVRIVGTAAEKASVLSFVIDGAHPHDIGTILDREGVAIRAGHHCAQPVMQHFGLPATARASFAFYNTGAEVDALVAAIHKVREVFT